MQKWRKWEAATELDWPLALRRESVIARFTTLDDLSETSLARLAADGFNPCAVVETSAGNFQAWLKHPRTFPKLLGTFAAQTFDRLFSNQSATPRQMQSLNSRSCGASRSP
jgi:hypothetical protein